jgi:hypothetical protein
LDSNIFLRVVEFIRNYRKKIKLLFVLIKIKEKKGQNKEKILCPFFNYVSIPLHVETITTLASEDISGLCFPARPEKAGTAEFSTLIPIVVKIFFI